MIDIIIFLSVLSSAYYVPQYYVPLGYGYRPQVYQRPIYLSRPRATGTATAQTTKLKGTPPGVYASLSGGGSLGPAMMMGDFEGPDYEDIMYMNAMAGAGAPVPPMGMMMGPQVDPMNPMGPGPNSMLNPIAFDNSNMDDIVGSDYEGFMKGFGQYNMMNGRVPMGGPMPPPAAPGMAPGAPGAAPPAPPSPPPSAEAPPTNADFYVTLENRDSFCSSSAHFLAEAADAFHCAELVNASADCGTSFFMANGGGDCNCVLKGFECTVEASDSMNNVYKVHSTAAAAL